MNEIMKNLIYVPLYNILIFFFAFAKDMGVAVILLTLLVRVLLIKQSTKAEKSRLALQKLQPEVDKIREKYKDDKERQTKEMLSLYKQKGISPFSSCLPTLFQLPFLIGLFVVFKSGLKSGFPLYGPIKSLLNGTVINTTAFGFLDLTINPNVGYLIILPIIAAVTQFVQSKMMISKNASPEQVSMNTMMLIFPVLAFFFTLTLPSALSIYWVVTTLFAITQQYFIDKQINKESQIKSPQS